MLDVVGAVRVSAGQRLLTMLTMTGGAVGRAEGQGVG